MQILDSPDTAVKLKLLRKNLKYSPCRENKNKKYMEFIKVIMPKSTYWPAQDACFKSQKK